MIQTQIKDGICILFPPANFNFSCHRVFRDAYQNLPDDACIRGFVLDFKDTEYLDSAALGMMLLLRKVAQENRQTVEIINVHGVVKDVLRIARFQDLFDWNEA
jgi:HptB-dependent secretion and biofilm anti anti-sigma factor